MPVDHAGEQPRPTPPSPEEQAPQPTRRKPPPVSKTPPSRRLQPGDLICGACGEGNPPMRKFCRRCGQSLVEAEVFARPWWKKLLPTRGPKAVAIDAKKQYGSSKRPDVKHAMRKSYRIGRLVVVSATLVAALAYAVFPPLRTALNGRVSAEKNRVETFAHPTYVLVHPVSVVANIQVAGYPGPLAVDGYTNTYWLAPWNPAREPTLTLTFGRKVSLKKMIFHSGADPNFAAYDRPAVMRLVFSNGEAGSYMPQDTIKPQTLTLTHVDGVTSVELQIAGVYPGKSGSSVAISEIEFFVLQL